MRTLRTLLPILLLAAAAPAHAAIYSTSFSGTVTGQAGTSNIVGSTVAGAFVYNSDSKAFLSFTVDGASATPGYNSIVSVTPGINPQSALFQAQTSAVQQGGNQNQTFALDLEALTNFTAPTALGILTSANLPTQLDPTLSVFSFYSGAANGTGIRSVTAALNVNSLRTQVPEPASLALLGAPVIGLALRRRRR